MKTCTQCGTPMTSDSPEGLCARCLLSVAMKDDPAATTVDSSATQDASPSASAVAAATIDIGDAAEVARRLPQFEILALLGRGGMGVVYKARQIQLDRIVALKILPPGDATSPGFVERFRREARSLAKLSHPNIVHLYEFGETNGLYFFVMEYVDGLNLRQMILAHRLTPAEALSVVPRICDALQFAHEEGIVHRDIKPENILIDKKGRVKIADFGLAKLLGRAETDPRLTVTGATLGTPRYMAPEQVDKPESVDHRADIYSLGVVFYEMLTGELPMGRFAPPSQKVQIDVRLDEIVLHALERDVELRYQHASQVRDDVEAISRASGRTVPALNAGGGMNPSPIGSPFVNYARPGSSLATARRSNIAAKVKVHAIAFCAFCLCWLLTAAAWNFGPWGILGAGGVMTIAVAVCCRKMLKARPELAAAHARTPLRSRFKTFGDSLVFLLGFVCLMIGVASSWDAQRASPDTVESVELFEKGNIGKADEQAIKFRQESFPTLKNVSFRDLTLEPRRNFTPSMRPTGYDPSFPTAPLLTPHSLYPLGSCPAGTNGLWYDLKFAFWPVAFPPQFLHGSLVRYNYAMMLALGAVCVLVSIGGWHAARGYKCSWRLVWRPGLALGFMVLLALGTVYLFPTVIRGLGYGPQLRWDYMSSHMGSMNWDGPHDLLVSESDRWAGDHAYAIAAQMVADIKDSHGYIPSNTYVTYKALSLWDPNVFHRWHMTWHGPRLDRPEIVLREVADGHKTNVEFGLPQMLTENELNASSERFNAFEFYKTYGTQVRFSSLGAKARAEFAAHHDDKAAALAQEWLAMVPDFRDGWEYGNAIHDGNEILGLIAMKKNDVAQARNRLLAACQTPGSPEIFASGPDFALADLLLACGERQAVLDYLQAIQYKMNNGFERLGPTIDAIKAGKSPKLATTKPATSQPSSTHP